MAALKEDYERCLSASAASQKDLQENLVSSKHQLLWVQEQLLLAEKVRRASRPSPSAAARSQPHVFACAGAGEEVPADGSLPQHEGDPDQEERADQGTEETAAEVASRSFLNRQRCSVSAETNDLR